MKIVNGIKNTKSVKKLSRVLRVLKVLRVLRVLRNCVMGKGEVVVQPVGWSERLRSEDG